MTLKVIKTRVERQEKSYEYQCGYNHYSRIRYINGTIRTYNIKVCDQGV